ncbi:DUF814 domain-containing protein [Candidatus Woesearchaeota archaeon]|nr:DUF814 domain-containing protein [Candidatus Woesearchaeota archaeon]
MKLQGISLEEFRDYDSILYVKADTKRLKAVEYIYGKKRVLLNKEREVRKTKSGGFAQSKYQEHVKWLKKQTLNWIEEHLLKKNVLRDKYDRIKIEIKEDRLRDHIWNLLKKRETGKRWFEKFRYERLEKGFIVGGKDKKSNEELLKRHLDKGDLVFHTEMKGSPFFILKESKDEKDIFRAALLTAYYSQDWKKNKNHVEVMYCYGKQIYKRKGMGVGTFGVNGKRHNMVVKKMELLDLIHGKI